MLVFLASPLGYNTRSDTLRDPKATLLNACVGISDES